MKKFILRHLNAALGAIVISLVGSTFASCEYAVKYGVELEPGTPIDPEVRPLYGVTAVEWTSVENIDNAEMPSRE